MSWFFRSRPRGEPPTPLELATGVHRSPGLGALSKHLDRTAPEAILDLGPSSTENLGFFSRYCKNISIQDLFRSAGDDPGSRSTVFRFTDAGSLALPSTGERFDLILLWDLIHYFEPGECRRFIARLAEICRPEALVFLIASSTAPVPMTPIQFRIESSDTLHYTLPEGERSATPQLRTRQVEGLMESFRPVRSFQLRNGLQESLFSYEATSQSDAADPVARDPLTFPR